MRNQDDHIQSLMDEEATNRLNDIEDSKTDDVRAALKDLLGMVTLNLTPAQISYLPGMKQAVTAAKEALRGYR